MKRSNNKKGIRREKEVNIGIDNRLLAIVASILLIISTANTLTLMLENQKVPRIREPKEITGDVTQTGTASLRILRSQEYITMLEKWNFVSFFKNLPNTSIDEALADIDGSYDYVLEWNDTSQSFEVYSTRSDTNPFTEFQQNKSYFVYLNTNAEILSLSGGNFSNLNLSLDQKWNAPFYPYTFDGNVSLYLDDMGSDYEYMLKWSNVNQKFFIYARRAETKPFDFIYMGEGQMIYVTNPAGTYLFYNKTKLENG